MAIGDGRPRETAGKNAGQEHMMTNAPVFYPAIITRNSSCIMVLLSIQQTANHLPHKTLPE